MKVKVNDIDLELNPGTSAIDAVFQAGHDVPYFCSHEYMSPIGACRMCLAKVGAPRKDRATGEWILDEETGEPKIFWFAFTSFILVGVQGWLGSVVVATNLHTGIITLHMLLAQVIVGILIAALVRASSASYTEVRIDHLPRLFYPVMVIAMIAGLAQLVLGTQVREAVDLIARSSEFNDRHLWIDLSLIHI